MNTAITWNKLRKHLKTVYTHRKWVRHYCFKVGLYKQGLTHDLSKYSPIEFIEGVRFYQGIRSPIDAAKEVKGFSMAWFHHKGRNKHHYEYWHDNLDKGGTNVLMPYKYAAELICDYLGAGRAYMGDKFSYQAEYEWWKKKIAAPFVMNKRIQEVITQVFGQLAYMEKTYQNTPDFLPRVEPESILTKEFLQSTYNTFCKK